MKTAVIQVKALIHRSYAGPMTNLSYTFFAFCLGQLIIALHETYKLMEELKLRIGFGFDAHRFVKGRRCILCGVEIPCAFGPDGHSDADVPVHALMDALLGALALGDIGRHFPESDGKLQDADSIELLSKVYAMVKERGYILGNADITIVLESPRLSHYIEAMRERIAAALETDTGNISVKATTEERMGYTGTGEGISSTAAVLLTERQI